MLGWPFWINCVAIVCMNLIMLEVVFFNMLENQNSVQACDNNFHECLEKASTYQSLLLDFWILLKVCVDKWCMHYFHLDGQVVIIGFFTNDFYTILALYRNQSSKGFLHERMPCKEQENSMYSAILVKLPHHHSTIDRTTPLNLIYCHVDFILKIKFNN